MTSMLEIEYDDSALLESLVEDIREFTDWMEVSEGKGGDTASEKDGSHPRAQTGLGCRPEGTLSRADSQRMVSSPVPPRGCPSGRMG